MEVMKLEDDENVVMVKIVEAGVVEKNF